MKTELKKKIQTLFILIIIIILSFSWFSDITEISLDADEAIYILDSQFYFHRKQGNYQAFNLPSKGIHFPWYTQSYRLLDQPQLGKYIFGAILNVAYNNPLPHHKLDQLYKDFSTMKIPAGKNIRELTGYLDNQIAESILIIRYASAAAGPS